MKAKKIENSDIESMLISSLPSRPTAPRSLGGCGFSAKDMKEAFDKLPLYIVERYNELLGDVSDSGEDSLAAAVPTGIKDGHTLDDLFDDVRTGELATYFGFLGKSLLSHIMSIYGELDTLRKRLEQYEREKKEASA